MNQALLFLLVRSVRGRIVRSLRLLKRPKYLVGILAFVAWIGFWMSNAIFNFFDVETEPNDTFATADPIATTVSMYGMLHANLTGNDQLGWGLQTGEDWFWYESPGDELITLAFCEREDCDLGAGRVWRVTVTDQSNTVMASFRTDNAETVHFGVEHPGIYFMQIGSALALDEDGRLVGIECKEWSIPTEPGEESVCLRYAQIAMVTTRQYNFTWYGTKLSPFTAHQ